MSIYLKNGTYYYDFWVSGQRYHGPTHEKQKGRAKSYEALKRAEALEKRLPPAMRKVPKLSEYAKQFLADIDEQTAAGHYTKNGQLHYHGGIRLLTGQIVWGMRLNEITAEHAAKMQFPGPASGNKALRVLRRMLSLAEERGLIHRAPRLKLYEDRERTAVIEPWLEELMLAEAREPLRTVMIVMLDSFMRPAEVVAIRWEDVLWDRNLVYISKSKTKKGKRFVGLTSRMSSSLQSRRLTKDSSQWVFPARSRGKASSSSQGHMLASSLDKAFRQMKESLLVNIQKANPSWQWPADLVLYSCRHTGATNYSDAVGANQLRVAAALGHTDLRTTRRYVHHADDSAQVMDKVVEMRKRA